MSSEVPPAASATDEIVSQLTSAATAAVGTSIESGRHVPADIRQLYEVHDYRHASAILAYDFPDQAAEIWTALRTFQIRVDDITKPGGNESEIPKRFSRLLRPASWNEEKLTARLVIRSAQSGVDVEASTDTHFIDYVKDRIAVDFEWNSKDQTFDRDLYAFRSFFEFDRISVAVLVTRGASLRTYLPTLIDSKGESVGRKFGASTTHIEKLLPRLKAGRSGGCPVLVFGITPKIIRAQDEKAKKR